MIQEKQQIDEIIANSQVAFMNGKYYEAYNQAQEAISIDPNCADAYQCAALLFIRIKMKMEIKSRSGKFIIQREKPKRGRSKLKLLQI